MTEEEVLKIVAGWGRKIEFGNVMVGDGEDREMWSICDDRAIQMWPSERQQRLERAPMQWEVDAITKRGSVTETVYDASPDLPDSLPKAIARLQKYLDSIPLKLRAKARVSFDTRYEYGESYANLRITYVRPETDEEWALRKTHLAERLDYHRELRRQKFERLKGEFEESALCAP